MCNLTWLSPLLLSVLCIIMLMCNPVSVSISKACIINSSFQMSRRGNSNEATSKLMRRRNYERRLHMQHLSHFAGPESINFSAEFVSLTSTRAAKHGLEPAQSICSAIWSERLSFAAKCRISLFLQKVSHGNQGFVTMDSRSSIAFKHSETSS